MNTTVFALIVVAAAAYPVAAHNRGCMDLPAADFRAARAVRDGEDWQNPYLTAYSNGIEVISGRRERKRTMVPVAQLEKFLRSLARNDWPYGSIVALQVAGLRSGLKKDDLLIDQNEKAAERILKHLCITVDHWPSA